MDNGASSYRRYLEGDEDALDQIVKEYFDHLVFFLERYVGSCAVAEDLALDVFAELVANKRRYDFRVSLKTYLFMMGRSRALDYLRRSRIFRFTELSEAEQMVSQELTPEERILADERKRALHDAIAQLSEEQRLLVHLVYFEDLSCEEAAKVLKKTRKQVYNLLYRAKNALRAILGEEGEAKL